MSSPQDSRHNKVDVGEREKSKDQREELMLCEGGRVYFDVALRERFELGVKKKWVLDKRVRV